MLFLAIKIRASRVARCRFTLSPLDRGAVIGLLSSLRLWAMLRQPVHVAGAAQVAFLLTAALRAAESNFLARGAALRQARGHRPRPATRTFHKQAIGLDHGYNLPKPLPRKQQIR